MESIDTSNPSPPFPLRSHLKSYGTVQRLPNDCPHRVRHALDNAALQLDHASSQCRPAEHSCCSLCPPQCLRLRPIWVYNLPYFAEKRAFAKLQQEFDKGYLWTGDIENYFDEFPDGAHAEDVMFLAVETNDENYQFDSLDYGLIH